MAIPRPRIASSVNDPKSMSPIVSAAGTDLSSLRAPKTTPAIAKSCREGALELVAMRAFDANRAALDALNDSALVTAGPPGR